MKKFLFILVTSLMVMMLISPTQNTYGAERIEVGSYTLSTSQTSDLAYNMRLYSGSSSTITGAAADIAGEKILYKYGYSGYATVAVIAAQLAGISLSDNDVMYAADHGYRVRMVITDYKNYHTSYSTQVDFEVVYF